MAHADNRSPSRRDILSIAAMTGASLAFAGLPAQTEPHPRKPNQRPVARLQHPPMDKVRVAIIGLGGRGTALLGILLDISNVQITALCDTVPQNVTAAAKLVTAKNQPAPAPFTKNETDFENLCKRDDIDLVLIATPWELHTPMALSAMRNGKHAAIEVPAAITLDECWQLVDTAEESQRHCIMLENCCYGETEMLVLNMVRQGVFGQLTHAEAAYLHSMPESLLSQSPSSVWRRQHVIKSNGNLYPTHGLGPVAQYLSIHHGDKFDHLVSMSSPQLQLSGLRDKLPPNDPRRTEKYVCGDINTSLIKTTLGRTIMLQFDLSTPRPYSRINSICGTEGAFADYPPRIHLRGQPDQWQTDLTPYTEKYTHPLWKKLKDLATKSGGHGGMDFVMLHRLIQCLREGTPLDTSIYDAAAWSSIFPLSIASVSQASAPVQIPDFTRGQWKD